MSATPPVGVPRRRVLVAALLAVPAAGGCSFGSDADDAPDPLIALADAARADAGLARAAIAADGALAEALQPLVDARAAHAAALEAEITRLDPDRAATPPAPPPAPALGRDPMARVREACEASGAAAAAAAVALPAERIGLVAAVAACCSTYAVVLG
ncbi:hypothetical protein [Pseudonocardia humida]|uniref:DUF4439 domain-containing protein n=1 Tax=Pseudonocardia humida TaxID=2800819 RepID=A0ABT0ZUP2_9PSEU|nr:hypothetical protein [Pseudonocardia humida]MCO1654443.1 hypothetical protein [Pseudonocardia humida]